MAGVCVERIWDDELEAEVQVFQNEDGTFSGYCFSKGVYVPNPYKDKPENYKPAVTLKTKEQIREEVEEIQEYPVMDLEDRKLKKEYLDYFGIKIGVSETDGRTPKLHYYPYTDSEGELSGYKVRLIESKRIWSLGELKGVELFGWRQALESDGRNLYITEGELDAVTLFQILKERNKGGKYADMNPAVVSLAHGASSAIRDLTPHLDAINRRWKEIILVYDMDEAGKAAVEETLKVLPQARVAELPDKDLNDCLVNGKVKAAFNAIQFNSERPKNTRLVTAASVVEEARQQTPWGYSYPYKALTQLTRGRRLGEVIYLGAGVKMGKSELLNDMVAHDVKEHGWKVFVAKPEESNRRTLQGVVGKLVNGIFHDPAIPFDYELFDKGVEMLGENLLMLDLYQDLNWETLKGDIRAAAAEGVTSVYIDPITVMTNTLNAADANTMLQKMAQEAAGLAKDLDLIMHFFCHLRAPDTGPNHERGGAVLSTQFAGSRAMMRSCHVMLGIEGNKDPDLPEDQRNIRELVLLEDRMTGNSGRVKLFWNKHNGSFNEIS